MLKIRDKTAVAPHKRLVKTNRLKPVNAQLLRLKGQSERGPRRTVRERVPTIGSPNGWKRTLYVNVNPLFVLSCEEVAGGGRSCGTSSYPLTRVHTRIPIWINVSPHYSNITLENPLPFDFTPFEIS